MTVYELGFLLSAAPTLRSKFLLCVLPNWVLIPDKTNADVERAIVWGWKQAFEGRWPHTDHLNRPLVRDDGSRFWKAGEPLCSADQPFRVAMAAFKADLSFEKQWFHFPGYSHTLCCRECFASKTNPDELYTATGPAAKWRARQRTEAEYLRDNAHQLPAFVDIPGWSYDIHRYDLMHTIYLGRDGTRM
jgi:hypothetical protein